jgi:hypothetical protein
MSSTQAGPRSLAAFSLRASTWFSRQLTQLTKSRALISRWAREYQWKDRAQARDAFNDQLSQQQSIRTRLDMNKLTLSIAQTMQTKAMHGFLALESVRKLPKDPVTGEERFQLMMEPRDLMHMLETAHKLSNDVLGKADRDTVTKIELIFGNAEDDYQGPLRE